jgi:hypothetical protein
MVPLPTPTSSALRSAPTTMSADLFADLTPHSQNVSPYSWQKTQQFGEHGGEVTVVVVREDEPPTKEGLTSVARFATELGSYDARARMSLHENTLEDESPTREYVEHHLDGLRFDVLTELFGDTDDIDFGDFIDALRLVRVALSPNRRCAVFDYSLGLAITDDVLAVSIADGGGGDDWSVAIAPWAHADD